ncbi:unnamed protein product, partial [Urochloa humidicola]
LRLAVLPRWSSSATSTETTPHQVTSLPHDLSVSSHPTPRPSPTASPPDSEATCEVARGRRRAGCWRRRPRRPVAMEDLGIEAKEAAVREVAKLLPLPELLSSIASIKSDYLARQQTNDAQLSTMVAEQVEQAHAGISALALSQETINKLRENFI